MLVLAAATRAEIIERLPTNEKVVALTFDACEAGERVAFDRSILDLLLVRRIPFTVFATGRFVEDNRTDIEDLARLDFVEIENHSWNHPNHMHAFAPGEVVKQVERTDRLIAEATGRTPQFFRFPAGNFNADGLKAVEDHGRKVVHWRWATGDPDPMTSADTLYERVMRRVAPGDILIFHINGRGHRTGEALPRIVDALEAQGYRFVLLSDYIGEPRRPKPPEPPAATVARMLDNLVNRAPLVALSSGVLD
jgi:peptidoglycan/xylan/chitin deacetylase (PgdA/CDA1 family)